VTATGQLRLHAVDAVEAGEDVWRVDGQPGRSDEQLGLVELMQSGARAGEVFGTQHLQSGDDRQPGRCLAGTLEGLLEEFATGQHHLASRQVDRRHDREVRARGLDQLQRPPHRRRVELGGIDVQHRRLAQPRQDLVHRLHRRCCTGGLAGYGKVGVEGEVR